MSTRGWRASYRLSSAGLRRLVPTACLLLAPGCSYTFNESSLPGHIHTVAIPVVDNQTIEPAIAQEVTDAISNQFLRDGSLQVVPEGVAHSAVYATITRYVNRVFGFNAAEQTEEFEVVVVMAVELKDLVKRKTVWKDERMVGRTTYFVVETKGQPARDELSGRQDAIQRLAEDVLARTVRSGGWN